MAAKKRKVRKKPKTSKSGFNYCTLPETREREFERRVNNDRAELVRVADKKWVNGTELHYYFFTSARWRGTPSQREVVRKAFTAWKQLGIGLQFTEVDSAEQAEIRIGFQRGDGAWSHLGRDVLAQGTSDRTMNFGWNIDNDVDTAIHEIGHSLGFPHEHQNPNAGIVWKEESVYAELGGPPNFWSRETTFWNIMRKLRQSDVDGSAWDKDSIMHYPFAAGLIQQPEKYQQQPLIPAAGLSQLDKKWSRHFYPPLGAEDHKELKPFRSVKASINPAEQLNFYIEPTATRWYQFRTFGKSDTVMVLFEEIDGEPVYMAGDDDSGEQFNASLEERLIAGRTYLLRVRLYWQQRKGDFGVMMW